MAIAEYNCHQKQQPQKVFDKKIRRPQFCNMIKKETPTQVLSCEFCEIFKNTFFTGHLPGDSFFVSKRCLQRSHLGNSLKYLIAEMFPNLCKINTYRQKKKHNLGQKVGGKFTKLSKLALFYGMFYR